MIKQFTLWIGIFMCMSTYAQYDIAVKIDGLTCADELLLANYYGDKMYIKDSSACKKGVFHFEGKERLATGVYLVVLPKKNYFEILISKEEDQMKYSFATDTSLKPAATTVVGSKENALFLEFNKYAVDKSNAASELNKQIEEEQDTTAKSEYQAKLRAIGAEVLQHRETLAGKYSQLFIGKLFAARNEVSIPDLADIADPKLRSEKQYRWIREHYWDNVDFSEDGLVLSPVFHNKLKNYFDLYMPPMADTAILIGDKLLKKIETGGSKEQFKYAVYFVLGYFEEAKYVCFDKALWHMAKNYYCAGKAFWADSAYVATMCEYAQKNEPILCGQIAEDINMPDTNFSYKVSMYAIDKPVTVVVFWDINCGTCKKELPIISRIYDSMTNEHIEIYAVYTKGEWENWKKRVRDEKYKFINVTNAFGDDPYRQNYNIETVPQIFVLDQEKKIRFKKIGAEALPDAINYLLEEQGIIKPEQATD